MTMQPDRFSQLKAISLCIRICILTSITLLRKVPKQIEDLELELDMCTSSPLLIGPKNISPEERKERKEGVEEAIESMKNLSHLELNLIGGASVDANTETDIEISSHSISIRSSSLLTLNCSSLQMYPRYLKEIQCPSLQKLSVRFAVGQIPDDFLASFSHRITELRIEIEILYDGHDDVTDNLIRTAMERIGTWIESMEHLQKLKIRCKGYDYQDEIIVNMKIRSKSLISIDTTGSFFNFSISECVCPQLQKLKCEYAMEGHSLAMSGRRFLRVNGVQPIFYGSAEIPFRRQPKLTLNVRQQPFYNMTVSETCNVICKYKASY